jgi:hypothetical protein
MKMWKSIGAVVIALAIGVLGYLPFGSAEEGKSIEQMITEAKTPEDHEAIAAFYEKEAQAAHQQHAEHQKMKDAYARVSGVKMPTGMVAHCDTVAKKYEEIAKEYEALAKSHKEMAK